MSVLSNSGTDRPCPESATLLTHRTASTSSSSTSARTSGAWSRMSKRLPSRVSGCDLAEGGFEACPSVDFGLVHPWMCASPSLSRGELTPRVYPDLGLEMHVA